MRSERDRRKTNKDALGSQEATESTWQDDVNRLTEREPSTLSPSEIKVLLVILASYLATAPSYECQSVLQVYMSEMKKQVAAAMTGPQLVVRPP